MSQTSRLEFDALQRLVEAGHQAYWVGGCVRDRLLGREPEDYDIATSASPEEVIALFPSTVTVGAQFGVVKVYDERGEVEVATFRSDHGTLDGRHPAEVRFARSPEEDVLRRDFTINGLLYDPLRDKVLDFVGGRADLEAGIVRAIGEPRERFAEDRLRLLRAVRFAARFGYEIEPETFEAIRESRERVWEVSRERLRDEIAKMLTEGRARRAFELLDKTGLLEVLLPEVARLKGVEQPPEFHPEGDVWVHTMMMLEGMRNPTLTLALGVLLHDVGKPATFEVADRIRFNGHAELGAEMAEEFCRAWRFSNNDREQVVALVRHHLRFKDAPRMKQSTLKRFVRMEGFEEHLELHRLDCVYSHRMLGNYEFAKNAWANLSEEELRPPRLLTGHDLMSMGYRAGPSMGVILAAVEDAQLNGDLCTSEEARRYVEERFPQHEEGERTAKEKEGN